MAHASNKSSGHSRAVDCPNCGKRYRWKPEAAGRMFKCGACLEKFRFPDRPGQGIKLTATSSTPSSPPPSPPTPETKPNHTTADDGDFDGYELDLEHSSFADPPPSSPETSTSEAPSDANASPARPENEDGYELELNLEDDTFNSASGPDTGPSPDDELSKLPPPMIDINTDGSASGNTHKSGPGVATSEKCPACGGRVKLGAVICINCGFNFKEGTKLKTEIGTATGSSKNDEIPAALLKRIKDKDQEAEKDQGNERNRNFLFPLIALIAGVALIPVSSFLLAEDELGGLGYMLIAFAVTIFIQIPFMIVGAFIVAKFTEVAFGPLGPAVLKLAAISLLPNLVGELLGFGFNSMLDAGGIIVQWMVSLSMTLGMLSYFFQLDLEDSWAVVIAFAVLEFVLTFAITLLLVFMLA